jgi:hypothetical protein
LDRWGGHMTINWKEDSEYILLKKGWDMERLHFISRRIWIKRLINRPIKWRGNV